MSRVIILSAVFIFSFATLGQAQTIGYADAADMLATSCGKDIDTHCRGVNLGAGRLKSCLIRNQASVSAGCRETYTKVFPLIEKRAQARVSVLKICDADARKLCAGVQKGDGQILECMLLAKRGVTPRCNQAITDAGYR